MTGRRGVFGGRAAGAKLETMKNQHTLASVLRRRRGELGLRQADVAHACGVTPEHICQIETGKRWPSPDLLPALAAALDLDLTTLYSLLMQERTPLLCDALLGS